MRAPNVDFFKNISSRTMKVLDQNFLVIFLQGEYYTWIFWVYFLSIKRGFSGIFFWRLMRALIVNFLGNIFPRNMTALSVVFKVSFKYYNIYSRPREHWVNDTIFLKEKDSTLETCISYNILSGLTYLVCKRWLLRNIFQRIVNIKK